MSAIVKSESALAWTAEQVSIIKEQIAKGCSDAELAHFAQVCQKTGLDPFSRQIYAIARKEKQSDESYKQKMTIQVSIDGLRLIAERSGRYDGNETFWCGSDGVWRDVWLSKDTPMAAKTIVYKTGCNHGFAAVVLASEISQNQGLWRKMPIHMLGKCSEASALRKAFPAELSGLYTAEEMPPQNDTIDATVVDEKPSLVNELIEVARQQGIDKPQLRELSKQQYGVSSSGDLTVAQLKELIKQLKTPAPALTPELVGAA